jgi:hypothetical protein
MHLVNSIHFPVFSPTRFGASYTPSRYRPEQALGDPEVKVPDFLNFRHYEGGKIVTLTHRPSLPSGFSWYSFSEAESTPGHMVPSVASAKKSPATPLGDRSRDPSTSSAVSYTPSSGTRLRSTHSTDKRGLIVN